MNLKKILAVVLSMTLLVSCLVSGMSLNTSAATPDQETAKTQLTEAWNKLYYKPVVALQGFYQKNNNVWEMRESKSDDVQEIEGLSVPCYTFTTNEDTKGAFILSGTANDIENKTNTSNFITNGSKVYFYVYDPDKNSSITDYLITSAGKSDPYSKNRTTTDVGDWRKYSITIDNWSHEAPYLGRVQFGHNTTILDKKISAVVYEEKPVAPTDGTLLELIKAANKLDLEQIQDGEAKTEFETALANAKTVYYSDEANAKAAIIAAWQNVKNNPEILFGNFYEKVGDDWTDKTLVSKYNENIGAKVHTPGAKGGFLVTADLVGTSVNELANRVEIQNYSEIYLYYSTNFKYSCSASVGNKRTDGGVSINSNGVIITLPATVSRGLVKFDLKTAITSSTDYTANKNNYNGTTKAWGRLQFGSADNGLTISQVLGVKSLNLATAFSDVFDAEGNAKDLTLAQLIDAYTKYDIEKNYDAAELIATVNDVCAANPKYAAFKTVAGYANKVQNVVKVSAPQYDKSNAGITVTKVYNTSPEGVPTFDLYTVGDFGTTTFTGQGLDDLGTTNHAKGFVRYSDILSGFNSNTNGLYLSYYIPSDKVPATTPIKIQVHYRGTSSTDGATSSKTAYLKQITLTERDKWAVLDLNDLKVDGLSTLTALNDILVDVCAEADKEVTMYFSPFAFTNSANYINTAGATTLTDYAEKYNATAFTEGERYLYEAEFIAARTAFNEALNSEFKISGDAIWSKDNQCSYDKGDSTLATAYRTFAQYTCPIENGKPVLNKVVVDGKAYNLVSRSILIARSDDNNFGTLDMNTVAAKKYFTTTGKDLTQKYWSVKENEDGTTATVTYSMLLTGVSKANAEGKYHMTRAMIEYKDGAGNTVQVYSKPREHGTIKETFEHAYENNKNLQWFPQVNN